MTAGCSDTPLAAKLGFKAGHRVAYVNPPANFGELLGELPGGVRVLSHREGRCDLIVCFTRERRVFEQRLTALRRSLAADGMLWVAWPKRTSKVATTMSEDVVRDVALPTGLVDTKVCAIDDTWSALRLVVRQELR
jgi:hypothetical protein